MPNYPCHAFRVHRRRTRTLRCGTSTSPPPAFSRHSTRSTLASGGNQRCGTKNRCRYLCWGFVWAYLHVLYNTVHPVPICHNVVQHTFAMLDNPPPLCTPQIPQVDRSPGHQRLLEDLCVLLLKHSAKDMANFRKEPPPPVVHLALALWGDGYTPRGRSNVSQKICLLDMHGDCFPFEVQGLPICTPLLTWVEMPKQDFKAWVTSERALALERLRGRVKGFKQGLRFGGVVYNFQIFIELKFLSADHHHLWGEFGIKGCVVCGWKNREGVKHLLVDRAKPVGGGGSKQAFTAGGFEFG